MLVLVSRNSSNITKVANNSNIMKEKEQSENVDRIIREALSQKETEDLLTYSGDPGLFELMGSTFRGRLKWVVMLSFVMGAVYFAACIYCAVQFYHAIEVKESIAWGGGVLLCMLIVIAHKQWYWMEMTRRALSRDIKRLQLQMAAMQEEAPK